MQACDWQCHVCRRSNSAVYDACSACGFPAAARGEDILLKRAARADAAEPLAKLFSGLPLWRKLLAYSGTVVCAVGLIWLKMAWTMQSFGIAALMFVGGLLLAALAVGWETAPSPPP
ncbi:hypothetical protein PO883_26130 [Massilia sp. DJPM01]|uniref:hypothetical protein n=1 Tax=Massilia sp. DJPM01 TaxID=3024404 RepID=UPI00259E02E4|nr:hypothetical protein [Massilia sp. DJPM01]MDM5180665.1 hypothetical protein [Massilia sp. DJPM01]